MLEVAKGWWQFTGERKAVFRKFEELWKFSSPTESKLDGLHFNPIHLRYGLFRWLLRRLVSHARAPYAVDGGDQRDFFGDYCWWVDRIGGGRFAYSKMARANCGGDG